MTHAKARAKRQTGRKPETTCRAGEQGERQWLSLTPISALIHYRLYMSKRLLSVDSVERAHDAFVRLLSPQGSATLPSLAANSKHCCLEWCISLRLAAGVDSPSPAQAHTHQQDRRAHTHAYACAKSYMNTNTNRHTNANIPLPLVSSAGNEVDMSMYPGAADFMCNKTLVRKVAEAKRRSWVAQTLFECTCWAKTVSVFYGKKVNHSLFLSVPTGLTGFQFPHCLVGYLNRIF